MISIPHEWMCLKRVLKRMGIVGILMLLPALINAQELAPIEIHLPYPMFVGTPQDFDVPNLENPLGSARPPFLAPAGTKNIALDKFIESTDNEPIVGEMELVNDGDNEAYDGSFVELGPGKQHITIDLENTYEIYAVLIWHFHKKARVYKDVIVQVSDDPDFVIGVETLFNNDNDNSSGQGVGNDLHYVETHEGKLIDCRGVHGQYVRLYSNGNTANDLNHYIEVEVYGIPLN